MKYSRSTKVMSAAVLSLLLLGVAPAIAQPNQASSTSSGPANTLIQLAEAAQSYAGNLLTIAQQQGVNTTAAQSLMSQGASLLAKAQGEVSTNATQAAQDALASMRDFRMAAIDLQSQVIVSVNLSNEEAYLQRAIQTMGNRTSEAQTLLNKACSSAEANATICSDANMDLAKAAVDLTNATALLGTLSSGNYQTVVPQILSLLKDADARVQVAINDINSLANSDRDQKAVEYVTNVLDPRVTQLQTEAQKANLTSSQLQQVQGFLSQAQTSLNNAVTAFQAGNFTSGYADVQQGTTQMADAARIILGQFYADNVQNTLVPKIAQIEAMALKANLTASVEQQVQSQLSQAQADLSNAVAAFQSGNISAGAQQVSQAMQLMAMALQEISQGSWHY